MVDLSGANSANVVPVRLSLCTLTCSLVTAEFRSTVAVETAAEDEVDIDSPAEGVTTELKAWLMDISMLMTDEATALAPEADVWPCCEDIPEESHDDTPLDPPAPTEELWTAMVETPMDIDGRTTAIDELDPARSTEDRTTDD